MSNRVYIREHLATDLDAYIDWQTDPQIAERLSWLSRTPKQAEESFFEAIRQQSLESRTQYFFAVVSRQSQEVIGDVGFTTSRNAVGDCGWFIRKAYQNKGYATKVVRLLVRKAFLEDNLLALTASCLKSNLVSVRIMDKCGFELERQDNKRMWFKLTAKHFGA